MDGQLAKLLRRFFFCFRDGAWLHPVQLNSFFGVSSLRAVSPGRHIEWENNSTVRQIPVLLKRSTTNAALYIVFVEHSASGTVVKQKAHMGQEDVTWNDLFPRDAGWTNPIGVREKTNLSIVRVKLSCPSTVVEQKVGIRAI